MDDEPDDELTVDCTIDGDTAVIRIAGEVDIASRDAITETVHDAVGAGATRLILDMSEVTFMDSSGIAAMIETRATAPVMLRKPSVFVERLIATTGLDDTFEVEP